MQPVSFHGDGGHPVHPEGSARPITFGSRSVCGGLAVLAQTDLFLSTTQASGGESSTKKEGMVRYLRDIYLEKLILHVLDPFGGEGLALSVEECELTDGVRGYLSSHITKSLRDDATTAASFRDTTTPDKTGTICQGMLKGEVAFISGSQSLARSLYENMSASRRIAAGDLAVCLFRDGNGAQDPGYLGLLKLDPSRVFRHVIRHDTHGNQIVDLELIDNVLPTEVAALQKCAFVQPPRPRPAYDLMLLDRQVRGRAERIVAKFFSDFLDCELALDRTERTRLFYTAMLTACNELRPDIQPETYADLRERVDEALAGPSINLNDWVPNLEQVGLTAQQATKVDGILRQDLPDRMFNFDPVLADGLLHVRRFRGDFGLQIDIRADRFDDVVKSVEWEKVRGEPDHYKVIIHTQRFREVVRYVKAVQEEVPDEPTTEPQVA